MAQSSYNPNFNQNFAKELGYLNTHLSNRAGGKRVMDWTFLVPGRKEGVAVTVNLESAEKGLVFLATSTEISMALRNSDIQALHTEVEQYLRFHLGHLHSIQWEDWLEVEVSGEDANFIPDHRYAAMGGDLKIKVSKLKRGLHPETGRYVTVLTNGTLVEFPEPQRITDRDDSEKFKLSEAPRERAYIPDTPENQKALQDILARMTLLRKKLSDVLQQETIQACLQNIGETQLLLVAPGDE